MQVEKTVFISYRRTNAMTARAVYQHLKTQGFDCFLDSESIDSGSFERIILNQIAARAHFVVILTPSALERCAEPGDWLRREIEYALDHERNVVPLMFDGFRYSDVQKYLTGKLDVLPKYNSLEIPTAYFDEAMNRLENRFLNKPLDVILHPVPSADKQTVAEAKAKIEQQPTVTEANLSAEEWFERGLNRPEADYDGKIADYSEAIQLNPDFVEAYYNRGNAYFGKADLDAAIANYSEAIHLNPEHASAYMNRGNAYRALRDYDTAMADYSEAIRLDPDDASAYNNRGNIHYDRHEFGEAIANYDEALRLDPEFAKAYNNRGAARNDQGDYEGAIADYTEAVRINPQYAPAYYNRGNALDDQGDYEDAIADYTEAVRINPQYAEAYSNRGISYFNLQKFDEAIADYTEAIRINPTYIDAHNNLGWTFYTLHKYDLAIAEFEAVLRIKPDYAKAKQNIELARKAKAEQK